MLKSKQLLLIALSLATIIVHASSNSFGFGPLHLEKDAISPALQTFVLLSALSLAPSFLIMLTSFTRIVIVLAMLRNALGLQQTPPNTILLSLALFLTIFTMMPIAKAIYTKAYLPFEENKISLEHALDRAKRPLTRFMLNQTREKDLKLMVELAKESPPKTMQEIQFYQLVPAFLLSELQTAFQIGFMIFLPFLLIDLIVSSILVTMGMVMVPPMSIALPIKILVFVLIEGWDLVVQALVQSFH